MKLNLNKICKFTNSIRFCRNFVDEEQVLRVKHFLLCGKESDKNL